jgi:Na+-driven multidrug efflux pump
LLLEGPVLPTLLRLSAPNVLNLLAIAGMITFDGLFLGRLGPDALAGVSLAFPFVMLIQHTAASGMGWRRLVRNCTRSRRRQARCR